MANILPSGWSWLSFLVGLIAAQFLLPLILGALGKVRGTATTAAKSK